MIKIKLLNASGRMLSNSIKYEVRVSAFACPGSENKETFKTLPVRDGAVCLELFLLNKLLRKGCDTFHLDIHNSLAETAKASIDVPLLPNLLALPEISLATGIAESCDIDFIQPVIVKNKPNNYRI